MKKKRRNKFWGVKLAFQCFFMVFFLGCVAAAGMLYMKYGNTVLTLYSEAQRIVADTKEEDFKAAETSLVYDANGDLMKTLKSEKDVYYLE